jgi:hypothetical protein
MKVKLNLRIWRKDKVFMNFKIIKTEKLEDKVIIIIIKIKNNLIKI